MGLLALVIAAVAVPIWVGLRVYCWSNRDEQVNGTYWLVTILVIFLLFPIGYLPPGLAVLMTSWALDIPMPSSLQVLLLVPYLVTIAIESYIVAYLSDGNPHKGGRGAAPPNPAATNQPSLPPLQ